MAAARLFRVAGGQATISCLKTRGAAPGGVGPLLLPTPPGPRGGAEGQNPAWVGGPALSRQEGRKRTCRGSGAQAQRTQASESPPAQARLPPVHSFIYLIIHKVSQVLKKKSQTTPHCATFLVQGDTGGVSGRGAEGSTLPSD